MIKRKTYSVNVLTSKLKPSMKKAVEKTTADFYLDKKFGWMSLEFNVHEKYKGLDEIKIIGSTFLKTKTVYKLNSLNVDLTNIVVKDKPYKYEIKTSKSYSLNTLKTELNIHDIIEVGGKYYTNTKASFYSSQQDFAFTDSVIDMDECKVTYRSDYIELECPKDCILVPKSSIFEPTFLNEYLFYIPSFYIIDGSTTLHRCVESNIEIHQSILQTKTFSKLPFKLYSKSLNTSKDLNMNMNKGVSDLVFKKSTHIFAIPSNKHFFNITSENNIINSNPDNYVFSVSKILNQDNINIIVNNYKRDNYSIKTGKLMGTINSYIEVDDRLNHGVNHYFGIESAVKAVRYLDREDGSTLHTASADKPLVADVEYIPPAEINIKGTHPEWLSNMYNDNIVKWYNSTKAGIRYRSLTDFGE